MELTESAKVYKYEVAFSFLKEDLELAQTLSDRLSDRFPTFIYTDRQDDVVATDAMESFRGVYGSEARIVVILYRPQWGKTNYTRIEHDAIQARSFESGQDFILLIRLEADRPEWYSESRIYVDPAKSSVDVIIGHIEHMVQTRGGQVRVETVEDLGVRLKREKQRLLEFEQLYNSREGVKIATEQFNALCALFKARREKLDTLAGMNYSTACQDNKYFMASIGGVALSFNWGHEYADSLMDARLSVELSNGQRFTIGGQFKDHKKYQIREYRFARSATGIYGWQNPERTEPVRTNDVLLNLWLTRCMNMAHKLDGDDINKRMR